MTAAQIIEIVNEIQEATGWIEYFSCVPGDDLGEWLKRRDNAWEGLHRILDNCQSCNLHKSGRTPEEAGMELGERETNKGAQCS